MRRASPALLAPLAAALVAACATPQAKPGTEPYVSAVRLRGVRAFDAGDLEARLATVGPGFLGRDAVRLDPDALALDRRRIEAFYRERGYYDARVTDVRTSPDGDGRVKVEFEVSEGAPVRVERVEVVWVEDAPDAQARVKALPLRPGAIFTDRDYDAARQALLAALRGTGYANAEVTQEAQVLPEAHTARAAYTATPGPRFRFGPVFVSGTASVGRDRIREQAAAEIHTGDWFDESKLGRAQSRVFDLGVFGGVRVTRGTPDPVRGVIPVVVTVREAPFRTIRAGPGVGIQGGNRWDVHGTVGWTDRNFYGDLRRLQLDLRAGYAWLLTPRKEAPVGLASAQFSQPGAISRSIDASLRLELEKGIEQAYDYWSERGRVLFPIRLAPKWTFVPSYNVELYQLSNVSGTYQTAPGEPGPQLQNCKGSALHPVCLLSFLEQRLAWDGRDSPLNTHRGFYVSLAVQEGFNVTGYGYRYLSFQPEARAYFPLGAHSVLAARARAGALLPIKETGAPPIVALFFAGGPLSMRGYYTRRLSPMVLDEHGDWVAVGGNGVVDGSLELRFDVAGPLGGAVFLDAGNVSQASGSPTAYQTALDPSLLQWAAGVGARYRTPFGPLRLDVGVRLPSDWSAGVPFNDRFPTVPFTDHREPIVAVHLTIGEAF